MTDKVKEAIQTDGGLYDLGWYLAWTPGEETAVLDGSFTAADLHAIADHMEAPVNAVIDGQINEHKVPNSGV